MTSLDRRALLALLGASAAFPALARPAAAAPAPITMWRDPGCGCCTEWAKRMEAAFRRPLRIVDAPNMPAVKQAQGVPDDLRSCHTALVDGVVVEGHVPPEDVKALIARRPAGVRGLAVPGMPAGSPGMDVGHDHRQRYQVFAFSAGGKRSVFATHG
ncbi:DUF411 domain-containing protein [Sphingomonas parva]|uniref:DUF411 domain-containing protein n=1 Tax=Sphingomonas parva TaxID=2555898 RepID=A0A4Y8ZMM5_9SPHN|nr:DUF411 domain-containing protein [Sphingomonas parva]TFI57204.1 DUF411 domain-containing protein [Sphingomonas parva]